VKGKGEGEKGKEDAQNSDGKWLGVQSKGGRERAFFRKMIFNPFEYKGKGRGKEKGLMSLFTPLPHDL